EAEQTLRVVFGFCDYEAQMKKEPNARAHVDHLVYRDLVAGIAVLGTGGGIDTADEGLNCSLYLL
ncbi:MAG TPA: hypothetical protein VFW31_05645, partial [Candidatus Angelobacter sp.]|nr:hypothetical protein [Candidatus Angelobacter sp.]